MKKYTSKWKPESDPQPPGKWAATPPKQPGGERLRVGDVVLLDGDDLGEVIELTGERRTLIRVGASHQYWDRTSFRRIYREVSHD